MEGFNTTTFTAIMALIGAVTIIAALLSGLIERSGLPQVAVFLALGTILGPTGLNLFDVTLDSPLLQVVATLSLVLVLFTDAVSLKIREVRRHLRLALLVLGPATLLSALLIALSGVLLLGLSFADAAILGAALASTDPVLLRGVLRRDRLPAAVRQALRLESGLNDAVLLPVVVIGMRYVGSGALAPSDWGSRGLDLFLLGPAAGAAIGFLAVSALVMVRRRIGIRRDYESLYSLGVVFAALPGSDRLFSLTCSVVLLSVVVHGGSLMWLGERESVPPETEAMPSPPLPSTTPEAERPETEAPEGAKLSVETIRRLQREPAEVVVLDVRTERSSEEIGENAAGAIRLLPDRDAGQQARALNLSPDAWLIAFCACPNDQTSLRVATELRQAGWPRARALDGGWEAWKKNGLPTLARG